MADKGPEGRHRGEIRQTRAERENSTEFHEFRARALGHLPVSLQDDSDGSGKAAMETPPMNRRKAGEDHALGMTCDPGSHESVRRAIDADEQAVMQHVRVDGIPVDHVALDQLRRRFMQNLQSVGARDLSVMPVCVVSEFIDTRDDLEPACGRLLELEGEKDDGLTAPVAGSRRQVRRDREGSDRRIPRVDGLREARSRNPGVVSRPSRPVRR